MGKFERGVVEEVERELVNMINERRPKAREIRMKRYAEMLYQRIIGDFPDIIQANHVGNTYAYPGNIELLLKGDRRVYVELKIVESGRGTRANISQNALTNFNLLTEEGGKSAISWSEFREINRHRVWVLDELNKFDDYPPDVLTLEDKADYLRNLVKPKRGQSATVAAHRILSSLISTERERKAAEIIINIFRRDREEKLKYIEYLSRLQQNLENIKKFTILLLAGAHTQRALREMWHINLNDILKMMENYVVYFLRKRRMRIEREDLSDKIRKLSQKDLFIHFKKNETAVFIAFREKEEIIEVIRVVFHWKNIFQGIKTPCLNVFDERFLVEDP